MIKLKLKRGELQVLTVLCNPRITENKALESIRANRVAELDFLFLMMSIGDKVTKKFYFSNQEKYKLSLSYAEAAAMLTAAANWQTMQLDGYTSNTIEQIKTSIYADLINYKRTYGYYGTLNTQ